MENHEKTKYITRNSTQGGPKRSPKYFPPGLSLVVGIWYIHLEYIIYAIYAMCRIYHIYDICEKVIYRIYDIFSAHIHIKRYIFSKMIYFWKIYQIYHICDISTFKNISYIPYIFRARPSAEQSHDIWNISYIWYIRH